MDKRALKILFNTYWSAGGWKDERQQKTPPQDLAYAKAAGVMFDPLKLTHDEVLQRVFEARDALDTQRVASAFLASLSTRRLELRSALGSYAVFRHLAPHAPIRKENVCGVCGQYLPAAKEDLNVLNFERFKWGGVRHDDSLYAMLDLELFGREEAMSPTHEDIDIFKSLIAAIKNAPPETTAATLQRRWGDTLKSNKSERDTITAILGFCGILDIAGQPSYRTSFVPQSEQDQPARHYVDMPYPACFWSQRDGINSQSLQEWFGHVL